MTTSTRTSTTIGGTEVTYLNHEALRSRAYRDGLLGVADEFVASLKPMRLADQTELFKALHACCWVADHPRARSGRSGKAASAKASALYFGLRTKLVELNKGLVHEMIRRSSVNGIDFDELLSDGLLSLLRCIGSFDPWRGIQFSTYACTSIGRAFHTLSARQARYREVVGEKIKRDNPGMDPVENGGSDINTTELIDRLDVAYRQNKADLTPLEQWVVGMRVLHKGLTRGATLAAVGAMLSLSKERVRQIQCSALEKLKKLLTSDAVLASGDSADTADMAAKTSPVDRARSGLSKSCHPRAA